VPAEFAICLKRKGVANMSLLTLPVTAGDITNLQLGIEFTTPVGATAALLAGEVNAGSGTPPVTVFSVAQQFLLAQQPFSEPVMAVDSLMNGTIQSQAQMTSLTTGFLAGQAAFFLSLPPATQTGAGGLIVWDSEVLGFALNGTAGFSAFAGLNTGANAGVAGDDAFAAAVSLAIFGTTTQSGQVLAFLTSFRIFFAANPTALNGANSALAADGITFGAEVGIALSNQAPGQVGAFLGGLVSNALIANAESLNHEVGPTGPVASPIGVALGLVPAALPLQGQLGPTFTLTVGQDNVISGLAFSGNSGAITGPVVPSSNVLVSAPLANPLGFFNVPTLTVGDVIQLSGTNNTLTAFFSGGVTVAGETIQGVQTWNITNVAGGTVNIFGGAKVGGPGPVGGSLNAGVQTLNYVNSSFGGSTLNVGLPGTGIQSVLTAINSTFNGTGSTVSVYEAKAAFAAAGAPTAITVTVGNGITSATTIDAGPDAGKVGYLTFNVVTQGGSTVTNSIALGATLATNATTVTLADDGANTTLFASGSNSSSAANWANLTGIAVAAAGATGTEIITGLETGGAGFLSALVGAAAQKFAITLDNANGNFADLTAWTAAAASLSIALGTGTGNEVDLNSGVVDAASAAGPAVFTGVAIIGDVGAPGTNFLGGTVTMTNFPGAAQIILKDSGGGPNPVQNANFIVNSAPTAFEFTYQDDSQGAFGTQIASNGSTTAKLVVDVGVTGAATPASTGTFAAVGYHTVALNIAGNAGDFLWGTHVLVQSVFGDTPTLAINQNETDFTELGNVFPTVTGLTGVGHDTVTVLGGTLLAPIGGNITIVGAGGTGADHGTLFLGITNASMIVGTTAAVTLQMDGPADTFQYAGSPNGITVISAAASHPGGQSDLEGSLGVLTAVNFAATQIGWTGATSGTAGATSDSLTDLVGTTNFFGVGGGDAIFQGGGGNTDFFGVFELSNALHAQTITDGTDFGYSGFWGQGNAVGTQSNALIGAASSTSADMSTITGFQLATAGAVTHDTLDFNVDAWAGGSIIGFGPGSLSELVFGAGNALAAAGVSTPQLITSQAQVVAPSGVVDLIAYGLGSIGSASGLVTALESAAGALTLSAGTSIMAQTHVLFAYSSTGGDIKIADVDFVNGIAASGHTNDAGIKIAASDMVDLGHVGIDLLGLSIHPADINFSYHGL